MRQIKLQLHAFCMSHSTIGWTQMQKCHANHFYVNSVIGTYVMHYAQWYDDWWINSNGNVFITMKLLYKYSLFLGNIIGIYRNIVYIYRYQLSDIQVC